MAYCQCGNETVTWNDDGLLVCDFCGMPVDDDENEYETPCTHCDGFGGNRYDDRITPCPVCGE